MPNIISKIFSLGEGKNLKKYNEAVMRINALSAKYESMDDEALKRVSAELQERANNGEPLDSLLDDSFALVREASSRTTGLRHYDVQLIGAMALNDGCVAEMKTGEGKTLVSTAAGYLNALSGNNVHIVTVNDYLAKRDAEWMGKIYNFLGMEVGLLQNGMTPFDRKPAYAASVTYGTNSEFGFDYLRDNTALDISGRVQRGHTYAVIDEVDSILIDEARTPLIISGLGLDAVERYYKFSEAVRNLEDKDLNIDRKRRTIFATESGLSKIEERLDMDIYSDTSGALANHLKQALSAEYLFDRDDQYVVVDGEVKIVDSFTGRIMEGRRYNEGLHQAIEAKERVELKPENYTLATVTLQNYFRMYDKISGMTGTALTEDAEFRQIYKLPVVVIPTNKPVIRDDKPDLIFRTIEAKHKAIVDVVEEKHAKGQPVLIGTGSVEESEKLSKAFDACGIPHEVLNAKNHAREAEIVADAGRKGAVTISTNMAGRGTDILLGGSFDSLYDEALSRLPINPENGPEDWMREHARKEANYIIDREGYAVRVFGGLCVIGTQRHESRRIDNQLRGRAGRQGDPGESQFYLSLEDPLLKKFGGKRLDAVSEMMDKNGMAEDEPLQDELVSKVLNLAQQEVESMHFAARKSVLEYDDVMDLQRKAIYEERNATLDGKSVAENLDSMLEERIEAKVLELCPTSVTSDEWDFEALDSWYASLTGDEEFSSADVDQDEDQYLIVDEMTERAKDLLSGKREILGESFDAFCTNTYVGLMDTYWIEHLTDMDYLKKGIGLRSFGHRDPLVEYREEAYQSFGEMVDSLYETLIQTVLRFEPPSDDAITMEEAEEMLKSLGADSMMNPDRMVFSNPEDNLAEGSEKGEDESKGEGIPQPTKH